MRRLLLAVALVGLLVFPSSAGATHDLLDFESAVDAMRAVDPTLDPPPNGPGKDFVVGGGQNLDQNFGLSAHSGALGEDPDGHVSLTFGQPDTRQYRGRVICLAVAGNLATVGVVPTNARSNDFPALQLVLGVRDSGLPGGTGDGIQAVSTIAANCAVFLPLAAVVNPIERGNLLVHDTLALP
jgi:hypothetical protein